MRKKAREEKINSPKVVFEDKTILILDKPPGWVVNDAKTVKNTSTIQKWLNENKSYSISKSDEWRSGIVHRLDKETSGVIIIAKDEITFKHLQKQFKQRQVKKEYLALLHGKLKDKKGEVDIEIGRLPWRRDRFGVLSGGRNSYSKYKELKIYSDDEQNKYSLVRFHPKTGRTHQIRVHAKYLGNPIVSDTFYAGRKTARNDRKWCKRLFLHAEKISFVHPDSLERKEFKVELAVDLKTALSSLHEI